MMRYCKTYLCNTRTDKRRCPCCGQKTFAVGRNAWVPLLLLVFVAPAMAGDVTLSWTPATQNDDGTDYTNPDGYIIDYGQASGAYTETVRIANPDVTSYVIEDLASGRWYFAAKSVNTDGIESIYSAEVFKDVVAAPNPPSGFTVQDETVYGISQSLDVVTLFPVGTVAVGSACDGSMSVNGHYRVPRDDVTFPTTVQPPVVFALCAAD